MPIEVKKYTCKFRCGRKAVNKFNDVLGHETHCWNNPANETCKTCKNEIYINEDGKTFRGCKIPNLSLVMDEMREQMIGSNTRHVRPIYKCPYYNIYTTDEEMKNTAAPFAQELTNEIKKTFPTIHFPYHNKISEKPVDPDSLPF